MSGMIAQFLAWPTLGVALLVFGFAPGVVLRLIVLIYRRGNPRRQELLGELYAVPRIERPFWVAEQLEVALFEGLRDRLRAWLSRRTTRIGDQLTAVNELERELERQRRRLAATGVPLMVVSEDHFARIVADDVSRGWRGRGWVGAQPEVPTKEDQDPPAGV